MFLVLIMAVPFNSRTENTTDRWETPPEFFNFINDMFHFTLDPCASDQNALCDLYYTVDDDGLKQNWQGQRTYCNPPYTDINAWTKKCAEEGEKEDTMVALLTKPATETDRWSDYIMNSKIVYFIKPRINFLLDGKRPICTRGKSIGKTLGSNFSSVLVIFEKHTGETQYKSLIYKKKGDINKS